jgi:transcriptional regulator with XRE-family HTH domain
MKKKARAKSAIGMNPAVQAEEVTRSLSARVQQERKRRNWTLQDLADRSGISRAMISKIERCESSPTAIVLGRLSGAFGLSMSELLLSGDTSERRLSRKAEQQVWQDPATGYTRRAISPRAGMPLQLVDVCLPARTKVQFPAVSYSALHQQIWLLEGKLMFHEGAERHELRPGDCLQLAGAQDCAFENQSRSACRYVVALIVGK